MKNINYFIPGFGVVLSTKKMKSLKPFLPDSEQIQTHLTLEKMLVKNNKDYKPSTFKVQLEKEDFDSVISEILSKLSGVNVYRKEHIQNMDCIDLVFQTGNLPIIQVVRV